MGRTNRAHFLRPNHRGLVLAPSRRLSLDESYKNLALVAPTGFGKTTRYVIPNVLLAEGSVVVTDPAGEIFRATSGHLEDRGFDVTVFAPSDLPRSDRFNPLPFWDSSQQLRQLATLLTRSVSGGDPFWPISAGNVLFVALSAIANVEDPAFVNLGNVRHLLNHLDADNPRVRGFLVRLLGAAKDDDSLLSEYRAFDSMDSRVKTSILATARAALALWSDPAVADLTASNSLDLHQLRERLTAIYFILPEHRVRYFSDLANLFYSTCFAVCLESGFDPKQLPVFFFLDEFGNLGNVHDIATVLTTLRKRRCSVSLILQELSQLRSVYGADEAHTILSGGASSKLFFSGLDLDTGAYVEKALGTTTEYDTTFGGIDDAARTLSVPLLYADQVRRLPPEDAILISGSRTADPAADPALLSSARSAGADPQATSPA